MASNRGSVPLGAISQELQRDYPLLWEIVQKYELATQDNTNTWPPQWYLKETGRLEIEPVWAEVNDAMNEIWGARLAKRNADERASD